jgi:sortase A
MDVTQSQAWHYTQRLLLLAGLVTLGITGWSYAKRGAWQAEESARFDREAALDPEPLETSLLRGRINIPRLGIAAMVGEGTDGKTLSVAVGHIAHTALPGRPGNVGLAAHRDTLFRNLKDVRQGDFISLSTARKTYNYEVVSYRIVEPTDVSVLSALPDQKLLTLVTCYPFYFVGHAPKRFIVQARQMQEGESAP